MNPKVDLYQPIEASRVGPPPLVIRTIVTPTNMFVAGGVPTDARRPEDYVLLSALPRDLQEKIRTAVQTIVSGM